MPGTFRKIYRPLRQDHTDLILDIKNKAEEIEKLFKLIQGREMSLAMTNLEQAIMWATKAIVLDDDKTTNDSPANIDR